MSKNIIVVLLEKLNPTLEEMVQKMFTDENNKLEAKGFGTKVFTDYDRKLAKLNLMHDITKSFSTYTKRDDILVSFDVRGSAKGTLMIDATIERDGVKYSLHTEMIYAGGYNIQRLHYRVLTKSNLPKGNNSDDIDNIKTIIKKLTGTKKIQEDISLDETYISNYRKKIADCMELSDDEILALRTKYGAMLPYSELEDDYELYDRGVLIFTKEANTKEEYEAIVREDNIKDIAKYKRINITISKAEIKKIEKRIEKLKIKLAEL